MKKNLSKKAFSLIELSIVILIIGILIAGVTQGSRLIYEMRISSAQALTKSSDVNSIPNIALWLETTSDKSFLVDRPSDTDAIGQWNNINPQVSENSKTHALQASAGSQPLYRTNGIGNLPTLRFDGSKTMTVADNFDDDSEVVTLFLVWKSAVDSGTGEMDLLEKWNNFNGYPYVLRTLTSYVFRAYDTSNNPSAATNTVRMKDVPVIISARRIKNGAMSIWLNGVKENSDVTDNTTATAGSTANNSVLGICTRPTVGLNCIGDISEIIIFSRALKNEERISVQNYLSKKWGIKVS